MGFEEEPGVVGAEGAFVEPRVARVEAVGAALVAGAEGAAAAAGSAGRALITALPNTSSS